MAELNNNPVPTTGKKIRVRKTAPKVDLTAMVDLAFLLITFFMLTTSLNKPQSLDIAVPDKSNNSIQDVDERRIVSLILKENEVVTYHGNIQNPLNAPQTIKNDLHEMKFFLTQMQDKVHKITDGKDLIVLIKPSTEARAQDIISTLDYLKLAKINRYMLSRANAEDEVLLAKN